MIERGLQKQIENVEQARKLSSFLNEFAKGFELLDDHDHERLDNSGKTKSSDPIIELEEFLEIINGMKKTLIVVFLGNFSKKNSYNPQI